MTNSAKTKLRSARARIKAVLVWGWFIVWGLLHLLLPMSLGHDPLFPKWTPFAAIGIWFLPLLIGLAVSAAADARKQKKRKAEEAAYRAQYVRPLVIRSERFGELVFEHDTREGRLESVKLSLPPLMNEPFEELHVEGYTGDNSAVLTALDALYDRAEEIQTECVCTVKEIYDDEGITQEDGSPVTEEFLRQDIRLHWAELHLRDGHADVTLMGGAGKDFHEHVGEHGITVEIAGKTGKLHCCSG